MARVKYTNVDKSSKATEKATLSSEDHITITEQYGAHNYHPLPVVITKAEGCWMIDVEGRRFLDMLSSYSALNFGHRNPRITKAAEKQLHTLTLTSRAFYNDQFGLLCRELTALCQQDVALFMNSGAEAVETAIKAARRWGYQKRGVPAGKAEIVTFQGNFHGRTTTIVGFSTSEKSWKDFGPFAPGFPIVAYGDIEALRSSVHENTVAVLIEPIQGEGGVIIPPDGYLAQVRELCSERNVLLIADEIQTGLCRTGRLLACEYDGVVPDLLILGKSLGGGITPISALLGRRDIMEVFTAGSHGSTFGGNPFACAIAREVLALIREEKPHERALEMGAYFTERLRAIESEIIGAVRARGLMVGIDVRPEFGKAFDYGEKLMHEGILCKDTREQTLRFTPPLSIAKSEIDWAMERIVKVFGKAKSGTGKANGKH